MCAFLLWHFTDIYMLQIWLRPNKRVSMCVCQKRSVKLDFLPETYRLDEAKDREKFTQVFKGAMFSTVDYN